MPYPDELQQLVERELGGLTFTREPAIARLVETMRYSLLAGGKRTYVSEFGLDGARELAASSHRQARASLASAAPHGAPELEQVTDFIATRSS